MSAIKSPRFGTSHIAHRTSHIGFTLVELLVVIGIIALLIGILLPALGAVRNRAKKLAASAQLESISKACESYFGQFNAYPGYFNESDIANNSTLTGSGAFSGTENMMVCLMGQVVDISSATTITLAGKYIDTAGIGKGPRLDGGRVYGAYYSQKSGELYDTNKNTYTELVDPWVGLPVLYFRAAGNGTTPVSTSGGTGIFYRNTARDYLTTITSSKNASYDNSSTSSLLATNDNNMAWFTINTDISTGTLPNSDTCVVKGAYVLWSAGGDGIYLGKSQASSIGSASDMSKFDDVVVAGGTR